MNTSVKKRRENTECGKKKSSWTFGLWTCINITSVYKKKS